MIIGVVIPAMMGGTILATGIFVFSGTKAQESFGGPMIDFHDVLFFNLLLAITFFAGALMIRDCNK